MTGKEANSICDKLKEISNFLLQEDDRRAFFCIGMLVNEMSQIVAIDQMSFNPTVKKDE